MRSEEFKKDANTYYEMYQAGLIDPDILNRDHQKQYDDANYGEAPSETFSRYTGVTMQKNGVEGAEVKWVEAFGDDVPEMIDTYVQTGTAISSTSRIRNPASSSSTGCMLPKRTMTSSTMALRARTIPRPATTELSRSRATTATLRTAWIPG